MSDKFFFKCTSNKNAPILVLDTFWEAEEMKRHPDYVRVDQYGDVIIDESAGAPNRIPVHVDPPAPKRPILGLPKRK